MDPSGSRRPFKRQRVDAYPRGSVLRVEVENFMTYKRAVIEPGPKLNLVLGPNGTGKSSLVCALCVGLAGKTNLLGRAEDVSSFVRRGARSGWVQITLSSGDPMRPHVVRREIFADSNNSNWRLDGREALMKDVQKLVGNLKVQLDNLCQFLPQDKVVEFAKMKPVDLLEATEKAIGNGELFEQHKQLIDERKKLTDHDAHKAALEASVQQLKAENERNSGDVRRIRQREQLLETVGVMKKRVPWVQFETRRAQYDMDKQKRDDAKRQLQQAQQQREDDEGPLAEREERLAALRADHKRLSAEIKAAEQKLMGAAAGGAGSSRGGQEQSGIEEQMNAALEEVQAKQQELQSLVQKAADREHKMAELQACIAQLEVQVAALPPPGDTGEWGPKRTQLQREQQDVRTQIGALEMQLEDLRTNMDGAQRQKKMAEEKLRRIDDSKMRRLQALEQRTRGTINAWQFVQQNRSKFRGPVYGPIAVEVECPDPQHVQYLEQQVAANVWGFFVTQHREDHDLLLAECRKFNFRPSIANYTGDPSEPIPHPRGEASEYARYGISQTLDRVFTAPNVVKKVLCDEARIHEAYVGDRSTRVEELFRDHERIQLVWTPDCSYKRTRSQYNRAAESTLVADTRPARLLTGAATADDGRERQEAQATIQRCSQEIAGIEQEMRELQQQKAAKEDRVRRLRQEMDEINQEIARMQQRHGQMRTKLKGAQSQLERLQKQADPRKKGPKLQRELEAAINKAFSKALELTQLQAAQGERLVQLAALDLGIREASMQCERIREASKQRQADLQRKQRILDQMVQLVRQSADECRQLKARAEGEAPLTEELQQQWDELEVPTDLDALNALIDEKSNEADAMLITNPAALRQYNERCRQISEQERQLAELEEQRDLARRTIDDVTARWLPELKRIVAQVNETFSANFRSVGCAGEVVLHEAPGEDFEKYAIEIRVKFREAEELQTLDANRQSGGERSVSTILYLIALQGVTVTPFRVVDEINQGMDPINERKVFMQLVDAACRDGTPQCFLLTPKLLPDLPFTRDVTVLQIMNGAHIKDVAAGFSMERLLGSTRMAVLAH